MARHGCCSHMATTGARAALCDRMAAAFRKHEDKGLSVAQGRFGLGSAPTFVGLERLPIKFSCQINKGFGIMPNPVIA